MNNFIRVFLWCLVFVIMYVGLSALDEWGRKEDAKHHHRVFQYQPYKTWS